MGVLYYFAKCDGGRELFALNKVYGYAYWPDIPQGVGMPIEAAFTNPIRLADVVTSPEEFGDRFIKHSLREWGVRIGQRFAAWAGDAPIQFLSEYGRDDLHDGLSYEESRALITGSAHDSDYEADGITYKRGSAW